MEETCLFQDKGTTIINNSCPYFNHIVTPQLSNKTVIEIKSISVLFNIKLLEQLHYKTKKIIKLAKITIDHNQSFIISIKSNEKMYDFEKMQYHTEVFINQRQKQSYQINTIQQQDNCKIQICFWLKSILKIDKNTSIIIELGTPKCTQFIDCAISNIFIISNHKLLKNNSNNLIKCHIKTYQQLPLKCDINQISIFNKISMISNLPKYSAPIIPNYRNSQMYLCHDFKGGYTEELNFSHSNTKNSFSYRSLHLYQTRIFNYFSHENISIPPKHWRILCRRMQVTCIGTFIIEDSSISQNIFLGDQFAKCLVYIAKKCQFDGYLINIERSIKDINKLQNWLSFFVDLIHKQISNSIIVWYDSISSEKGTVLYQNQLNHHNLSFYKICDYFFTNYWWNQGSLIRTNKNTIQSFSKRVFIGNDCFGRNTYGGGKQEIYRAANKIQQIKNSLLNIALFAPAYTYQCNGGSENRMVFHNNENILFKGLTTKQFLINDWKITQNGGNGWNQQGDWSCTSHQWCIRQNIKSLKQYVNIQGVLRIQFMCKVVGTPPNCSDPYKIVLQIFDKSHNVILHQSASFVLQSNVNKAGKQQEEIRQFLQIDGRILDTNSCLRIIQAGKDVEGWGGHFGVKFAKSRIFIHYYSETKHWTSKIVVTGVPYGSNYHSYCNMGHGNYFHFLGTKRQKNYDYLCDFDVPATHIMNHPMHVELEYNDAYLGGSSLKINNTFIRLIKFDLIDARIQPDLYLLKVIIKGSEIKNVNLITDKNKYQPLVLVQADMLDLGWCKSIFKLPSLNLIKQTNTKQLFLQLQTLKSGFLLGQIQLSQLPIINQGSIKNLDIKYSPSQLPVKPYSIDIQIQAENLDNKERRLLLCINSFNCFGYSDLNNIININKIPVFEGKINLKIYNTDSSNDLLLLYEKIFNISQLILSKNISLSIQ